MSSQVAAIVLAAGASRRLGRPKQLLVYCGETLLQRAIRLAAEADAAPVLAVLGAGFEAIAASIATTRATPVCNEQWDRGIATSIHAGLNALHAAAPLASGVLIMSCDQPHLTAEHLRHLLNTFTAQPGPSIVASTYADTLGVPTVFPRAAFPHLLAMRGDKGARQLLLHPPLPLIALPFPGGEIDIDSPDDLAQLA